MKTFVEKKENIKSKWFLVDANGQTLGRMAVKIAVLLMGKHKPTYTPFLDTGDHVVIINADKIKLTGRKMDQKQYFHHTGYPGQLRSRPIRKVMADKPEFVVKNAVRLMLPKNRLGRHMLKKLKVYSGNDHPHQAQKPEAIDLKEFQKTK